MLRVLVPLAVMVTLPLTGYAADITRAWYDKDTDIYGHRIMGDISEHLRLNAELSDGTVLHLDLGADGAPSHVFEDMEPRLADMNGDGVTDLVVIETDVTAGAALAIYTQKNGKLAKLAETPHIGTPNRWLAPIGVGDFNDDGKMDVGYIDRPHLARMLRVWTLDGDDLREIGRARNLTNHRIGEEFITGGVRTCEGRDEMLVVTADWDRIVAATFEGKEMRLRSLGQFSKRAMKAALAGC